MPTIIALSGTIFVLISALFGGIWSLSSLVAEVKITMKSLRAELDDVKKDRVLLASIPDLLRRVEQIEEVQAAFNPRLAVVEKVISMRNLHIAKPQQHRP